jgi:proteasome lid subunit RPN8/RPN11
MSTPARKRLQDAVERANPVLPVHLWQTPVAVQAEILVVTHLDVYSMIHEHAVASLPNETGGFLLGYVAFDSARGSWHVYVDETMPVDPVSQDPVGFSFSWRDVDRVRSYRENQGKALLGWYHTHPDVGVFLSETDLEKTHRILFADPFQLALVYDPLRSRAGYFFWEAPQIIDPSQALWREFEIAVRTEPSTTAEPVPADADAPKPDSLQPDAGVQNT